MYIYRMYMANDSIVILFKWESNTQTDQQKKKTQIASTRVERVNDSSHDRVGGSLNPSKWFRIG